MKAILYVRVSTMKQVNEGDSIDNQTARLKQYAALHGFSDIEVIADEGLSGKTIEREGLQNVMHAVRTHGTDAVIVYSLSRFARNTIATLEAIEVMNKNGVAFHSLTEQLDTTSPIGRFFLTTIAALAQLEREQIGERTRSVMQFKKAQGERVGQIPFGSMLDTTTGKLVDDVNEQAALALVHELHERGLSYTRIASELESRNMMNKAGRSHWTKQQIHRIIRHAA